jgi:hypothetical protein
MRELYPFKTLPDYLAPGLDLVLIGINPGLYSVERGLFRARVEPLLAGVFAVHAERGSAARPGR